MRILVAGACVIGSVCAGKLPEAGHEVALLARGLRLSDLQAHGLVLEDAGSGQRTEVWVPSLSEPAAGDRHDLALVPGRAEQLAGTLPVLTGMTGDSDVLFFGTAGWQAELAAAVGGRALFGFPAAGVRDGPVVRYVLIRHHKTMLGDADGTTTPRVRQRQEVLSGAGFPVPGTRCRHQPAGEHQARPVAVRRAPAAGVPAGAADMPGPPW
jgi:2-dehydropantoate 2-reductase